MFSIEGNIGSGKSTLIQRIKLEGYNVLEEPVPLWTNYHGHNLLQSYYQRPDRYAYLFQRHVLETQTLQHKLKPTVIERSISSTRFCFTEVLHTEGLLTNLEYELIKIQYEKIRKETELPSTIIYLRSEPIRIIENIQHRAREGEDHISLHYLQTLHEAHDDWLIHQNYDKNLSVIVVDIGQYFQKTNKLFHQLHPYIQGEITIEKGQIYCLPSD